VSGRRAKGAQLEADPLPTRTIESRGKRRPRQIRLYDAFAMPAIGLAWGARGHSSGVLPE
jgi:hypothetical protein